MTDTEKQNDLSLMQTLWQQANEIDSAGHNGWGNTMRLAADRIADLREYKFMYENLQKCVPNKD